MNTIQTWGSNYTYIHSFSNETYTKSHKDHIRITKHTRIKAHTHDHTHTHPIHTDPNKNETRTPEKLEDENSFQILQDLGLGVKSGDEIQEDFETVLIFCDLFCVVFI